MKADICRSGSNLFCKLSKQKLNTKSSTESEIVGLSEYVPYNIWFINFITAKGYPSDAICGAVFFQMKLWEKGPSMDIERLFALHTMKFEDKSGINW